MSESAAEHAAYGGSSTDEEVIARVLLPGVNPFLGLVAVWCKLEHQAEAIGSGLLAGGLIVGLSGTPFW